MCDCIAMSCMALVVVFVSAGAPVGTKRDCMAMICVESGDVAI